MGDGAAATLAQMPPWGWALLLLGSGGAGTLSGLSLGDHDQCAPASELARAESDLQAAQTALTAANATVQSLIEVIKDHNKSEGWIE